MGEHLAVGAALEGLERRLLEPEVRRSAEEVGELLADDFVEVGADGNLYDKAGIIAILQKSPSPKTALTGFKARPLAPDVYLVTFYYSREATPERPAAKSFRSSVWKRANGRWRMAFHQGTPTTTH